MYIFTLTHTCPQNTNNIICTHKNIHKIYSETICGGYSCFGTLKYRKTH